ncbi:hypothetical protein E4U41_005557 [Claviceps citrina]|nr:hypothetical protein E4U41_005557 [Claviceps citrina]
MKSDAVATAAAAAAASVAPGTRSILPQPVALNASDWLGIDGNWSTYAFLIGNNNPVNVLFSTSLSEFWAVGPAGCPVEKRIGGDGQYGFDTIAAFSAITNTAFSMSNVLMSAISSTDYYLGYIGVGLRSGSFGDVVASPPLRQAVSSYGWIPSYSYGYTAGASYRGVAGSATLGGYDAARFIPHDHAFTMDEDEGIPRPRVRGIELFTKNGSLPAGWASGTRLLMTYDKTFTAIIDTSTPYLWLPPAVCDQFAQALNMSYNDTFGLYTLTDDQYRQYSATPNTLSLTFSLSSKDNNDNFGLPLNVAGVVNITLPIQSFVSLLQYPFMNATVRQGDSAVPYFTLRKAANDTFIIGNAFMQESYLITRYDSGTFSIHQALFPLDPVGGAQLRGIDQPPGSPFPPPANPNAGRGLSTGEMVSIAVGAVAFGSILLLAFFCYRRHRRQQRERVGHELHEGKDTSSFLTPDSARGPVPRLLSRFIGRRHLPPKDAVSTTTEEVHASASEAPDCQIYELPAPVALVELDAGGADDHFVLDDSDLGTDSTQSLTAYEIARIKLDRQLQGPVPEYTPPADGPFMPLEKTSIPDSQFLDPTRTAADQQQQPSPVSPTPYRGAESTTTTTYLTSEPSPVSPRGGDWSSAYFPSPVTISALPRSNSLEHRSRGLSTASRSLSVASSFAPSTAAADAVPRLPALCQKTPIDQSRVVCLGPLPENIQLPGHGPATRSRIVTTSGNGPPFGAVSVGSRASVDSLGSNFTEQEQEAEAEAEAEEEEEHVEHDDDGERAAAGISQHGSLSSEMANQAMTSCMTNQPPSSPRRPEEWEPNQTSRTPQAPDSDASSESGRIDPGRDLVHVPQVADKRYSWEDVLHAQQ